MKILERMSFDAWMSQKDSDKLKAIQPVVFTENTQPIDKLPNYISGVKLVWYHTLNHDIIKRILERSKINDKESFYTLLKRLVNFVKSLDNIYSEHKNSYHMVYKGLYFVSFFNSELNQMNIRTVMGSQTVDCVNYFVDNTEYLD